MANSENGDLGAIAEGQGACCMGVESFPCPDANELGRTVLARMNADGILPQHVGVDSVGVGAGTANELKWRGKWVRTLNGAERAFQKMDKERWREAAENEPLPESVIEEEQYGNLRSQMWWQARIDLQQGRIALPNDPELIDDLTIVRFETRGGKIWVESKEKLRSRLGRSPDKGDAVVYWNWVRPRQRRPKTNTRPTIREMLEEAERAEHIDTSIERHIANRRRRRNMRGGGSPGRASLIPNSYSFWR